MKKGEKLLLVLGALLIAAGVFVGVTLGWDYSPNNYAYNEIEFTTADTETGECSFVSVQLSDLEVNIYSTTDKTVSIAARGAKTPDRVSVVARRRRASHHGEKARPFPAPCRLGR